MPILSRHETGIVDFSKVCAWVCLATANPGVKLGRKPKLTDHQKREAIRRRDGETVREIARSYNVSHSTISRLAA
jgi:DNA invertase Pin-like site-specific DNA recombinase